PDGGSARGLPWGCLRGPPGRGGRGRGRWAVPPRQSPAPVIWCLGEQRETPPIARLRSSLGGVRSRVTFFDGFPTEPGVERQDMNALDNLPEAGCDVLTLFRAS